LPIALEILLSVAIGAILLVDIMGRPQPWVWAYPNPGQLEGSSWSALTGGRGVLGEALSRSNRDADYCS